MPSFDYVNTLIDNQKELEIARYDGLNVLINRVIQQQDAMATDIRAIRDAKLKE